MASYFFSEPFYSFNDFDRLFEEAFNNRTASGQGSNNQSQTQVQRRQGGGSENGLQQRFLRPRMDVHEDNEKNLVTATFELPGLTKENVAIDVHNNALTISGESRVSADRDEHGYAVRERRFGRFSRSIPLPQGINAEEIKASMENGVLTVSFPKSTPEQAPKKITIA